MKGQILNTRTVRLRLFFGIAILILMQSGNIANAQDSPTNAQESPTPTSTPVDKTPYVLFRLESAISIGDKSAAENTLAELEKLIPADSRLAGFRQKIAAIPASDKFLAFDLGGGVKMEFVLIRPGSFMMGSDKGSPEEKPVHKLAITKPFFLGKHEVTQAQYQAVMGANPAHFKGDDTLPVEMISWNNCQEFLKKLNEKIPGKEFRLPTEAQWEYACRAGSTTDFFFGDDESLVDQYAWNYNNGEEKTHLVGVKKPNAWGLYDMHGNVWEWCQDFYGGKYYETSPAEDPKGPQTGPLHVLRGGSWDLVPKACRSFCRYKGDSSFRHVFIGLRICCSLPVK